MKIQYAAILLIAGILAFAPTLKADDPAAAEAEKEKHIAHLFVVMHMEELQKQILLQTINMIIDLRRKEKPQVPAKFWEDAKRVLNDEFSNSMQSMERGRTIVYAHHYSDDDIKGLTAFYESPLGQKMVKETPGITTDMLAVGKAWGYEVGARAVQRLKEIAKQKGYAI